jgi:hypothetical protein
MKQDTVCCIYYPKDSSGIQTDLTRDEGWESGGVTDPRIYRSGEQNSASARRPRAGVQGKQRSPRFCDGLSYSYKKEYADWIVTAKREATRAERVHGTVERLHKQWKKPRDL